ncbi:MAG: YetF domain-containing protein [Candidatus Rokuibacteriota bacterium]
MDSVLRAGAMYLVLLVVFRIVGKRTLAQITPFDMVLLLIIAESTQQALVGPDFSIVNAVLVIVTLVGIDIGLSRWRHHSRRVEKILDDMPVVLVDRGRPLQPRMDRERVDVSDILEAARLQQGLERMDQVKYAVLETNGEISIIPWRAEPAPDRGRAAPAGEILGG